MPTKLTRNPRINATLSAETRCSNEECKLRDAILTYLRGRKAGKRYTGGELPVRFEDIRKALGVDKKDFRDLDRALQWLRRQKKIRYASRAGWEIWE